MDPLLELLQKEARLTPRELAERVNLSPAEVEASVAAWEADGTILGYQSVLDPEKSEKGGVLALIEVKITPRVEGGFDRIAERIAKFDQVRHCWLMSGGFDLAVMVQGKDLREVARFVAENLSVIDGVISTATHFHLRTYKQAGFLPRSSTSGQRLAIAP